MTRAACSSSPAKPGRGTAPQGVREDARLSTGYGAVAGAGAGAQECPHSISTLHKVGAVILAAGQSSRFRAAGGPEATKLVANLDGKPIVRRVAEAALAAKARPVVVVTGYARSSVEAALAGLDVLLAFNPNFASGLASSLKAGLAATPSDAAGALVLLGDMPQVGAPLIDGLIEAFVARKDALAAAPLHEGRRGNPVLLGRGLFEAAMRLKGDEGARRLIGALSASELVEVEASDRAVTFDIDTPGDLAAASRFRGGDV